MSSLMDENQSGNLPKPRQLASSQPETVSSGSLTPTLPRLSIPIWRTCSAGPECMPREGPVIPHHDVLRLNHPIPIDQSTSNSPLISVETTKRMIDGEFSHSISEYIIFDCRYPYEFDGGHIPGAINLPPQSTEKILKRMFFRQPPIRRTKPLVIIFHCEFSSHRGPKARSLFRTIDRNENRRNYPNLYYPYSYVIKGGYQQFYADYPYLTDGYVTMKDKRYSHDLVENKQTERQSRDGLSVLRSSSCPTKRLFG